MASSFMADIGSLGTEAITAKKSTSRANNTEMKMEDFLKLMVVQLQSQTIDDTADTGEMLNQLVQMQMVTALSNMTDASVMSYASSLVGKEVTIATVDKDNNLQENVLRVIGTGLYDGQQVIFCDDGNMYQLSQIMAVGRIPQLEEDAERLGTEKEINDRIDKLISDIKNGYYDKGSTGGANSGTNADDADAVNGSESAQESGSDAGAESSSTTHDPYENGPDGMNDPTYKGELGQDKATTE